MQGESGLAGRLEGPVVLFNRQEGMMVQCFRAGCEQSTFAALKKLIQRSSLCLSTPPGISTRDQRGCGLVPMRCSHSPANFCLHATDLHLMSLRSA